MEPIHRFADVVITGVGVVSPLGLTPAEISRKVRQGESGIAPLQAFDLEGEFAGEAPAFDLSARLKNPKSIKLMSRGSRLALYAACDAVATSGLDLAAADRERIAVEVGSGHTGIDYDSFFPALQVAWRDDPECDFAHLGGRASKLIDAYFSLRSLSNAGVGLLAAEFDLRGPSNNYVQNDTASAWALQAGAADIEDGIADFALVGGYDSLTLKSAYLSFFEAGLLARGKPMTPFGAGRSGATLGEGAAFFFLESGERARHRQARPFARLEGFLSAADAAGEGWVADGLPALETGLRRAFDSGLRPDYVIARGISMPEEDNTEAELLRRLGIEAGQVSAWKGWTGYLGAAAAAVELALTVHAVRAGCLPAPLGGGRPDPRLPLEGLPDGAIAVAGRDPLILLLSGCWAGQASALWFRVESGGGLE